MCADDLDGHRHLMHYLFWTQLRSHLKSLFCARPKLGPVGCDPLTQLFPDLRSLHVPLTLNTKPLMRILSSCRHCAAYHCYQTGLSSMLQNSAIKCAGAPGQCYNVGFRKVLYSMLCFLPVTHCGAEHNHSGHSGDT